MRVDLVGRSSGCPKIMPPALGGDSSPGKGSGCPVAASHPACGHPGEAPAAGGGRKAAPTRGDSVQQEDLERFLYKHRNACFFFFLQRFACSRRHCPAGRGVNVWPGVVPGARAVLPGPRRCGFISRSSSGFFLGAEPVASNPAGGRTSLFLPGKSKIFCAVAAAGGCSGAVGHPWVAAGCRGRRAAPAPGARRPPCCWGRSPNTFSPISFPAVIFNEP